MATSTSFVKWRLIIEVYNSQIIQFISFDLTFGIVHKKLSTNWSKTLSSSNTQRSFSIFILSLGNKVYANIHYFYDYSAALANQNRNKYLKCKKYQNNIEVLLIISFIFQVSAYSSKNIFGNAIFTLLGARKLNTIV